ncbi:FAD binding domain-containing protein [Pedobacter sandarakinus]|uniref:FAD binding domain-containing protein n=1 Tax=Pedobacter sandarakinus TaxID=353156 RepID=UPI0022459ACD|nr:xanthine dehydrogenase family protein subunit M [Pedobacter sandarakinus]MCX2575307.1 xanthine dehydrogenase family protein subunit M [Pedobacter sandarakinus]
MRPFKFTPAKAVSEATRLASNNSNAKFLAGGTNLIDLMKEDVERPDELVSIDGIQLDYVKELAGNGVELGALGKNTETANHPLIRQHFPLLTQAILAGASAQIRNMATNGGNLMQRTRCSYFYDVNMPCNKRAPGTGCGAIEGINRMHAIFGWSNQCIAVYPSDMAVALSALEAVVHVQGADGQVRAIAIGDFHRLPGDAPEKDNSLKSGEIITSISIPKNEMANHSYYLKVRDRASYAFALVSVGAALAVVNNKITKVRIAMGGVAHKPWRALAAEKMLIGKSPSAANFKLAADAEMKQAKGFEHNRFKIELGRKSIALALEMAMRKMA